MEENKKRIKAKLIKMINKYKKYKRISDELESKKYSDSWLYKYRRYDRPWYLECKIELYMLKHYSVNEAMVSDILEGRVELDDVIRLTDDDDTPSNKQRLHNLRVIPYVLTNKVWYGWKGIKYLRKDIEDKKLQKYYDTQRAKQGWCFFDVIDVSYSLNAFVAGMLETYVCKAMECHRPCWYFVEEFYQKYGNTLPLTFEEYDKCWNDQYKADSQIPPEFEEIGQQIRDYEFKTIRELANTIRMGADKQSSYYIVGDKGKSVEAAREAFKKVLDFYDELED